MNKAPDFHLSPEPIMYKFKPKKDITTAELAHILYGFGFLVDEERLNKLGPLVARHFEKE